MAVSLSALACCWVINPTGDFRKDDISSASMDQLDGAGADQVTDSSSDAMPQNACSTLMQYIIRIHYSGFRYYGQSTGPSPTAQRFTCLTGW